MGKFILLDIRFGRLEFQGEESWQEAGLFVLENGISCFFRKIILGFFF